MSVELVKTKSKGRSKEKTSNQEECEQVYEAIQRWKAHDGAVLIPVVRKSTVALLQEKAKPRWWKLKKSAKSTLCITTPQHLQREIESTADDVQVHELFLLISRQVDLPELHFDVPAGITNLYIIRCTTTSPGQQRRPTGTGTGTTTTTNNNNNNNKLILNGTSTFAHTRLDEWQTKRPDPHNLILGPGVVIQLSGAAGIPWTARDALGAITKSQREEVTKHVRAMCEAKYDGAPQWDQWRGPVNKLLDVAAGTASATQVVECYAGGIVVQAASTLTEFGVEGLLKVSAGLLCVSGPGQVALAGVAVAAAVYFVPWEAVWAWFRAAFGALLSWLLRAWENLKAWVSGAVAGKAVGGGGVGRGKQGVEVRVRPILLGV